MNSTNFPSFDLHGQVALVTGAARGIGHACALALAHAGADVVLGLRDANSAAELAAEIEGMGRRPCACKWISPAWRKFVRLLIQP